MNRVQMAMRKGPDEAGTPVSNTSNTRVLHEVMAIDMKCSLSDDGRGSLRDCWWTEENVE